ncbi:putative transcriptional regulator [Hathewaya proteolytica DSM 3090]|uniref:Putative transcriptional regulator n=1 Tax=Hathewaya proteolytica DSM 3090 TaxID=1121331 RepID=A0A1M6L3D4_9CLOT|nr:helix-turn-helix transcriptional regulator [Hathewaya proteolytica]SHJ65654.1 putative transcriptional regulator [Hathewaya proteolytica DSM 3090]
MIKVKITDILEEQERSIRWLAQKCDIHYSTVYKFCTNQTESVNFEMLDKICDVLHCKVSDVLERVK